MDEVFTGFVSDVNDSVCANELEFHAALPVNVECCFPTRCSFLRMKILYWFCHFK